MQNRRHEGVKLSETSVGRRWLENFVEPDVPTATILLDSLRFVSLTTLHGRLTAQISGLLGAGKVLPPTVAVPERKLKDFDIVGKPGEAIAYVDFHPGSPPAAVPGSDAFVAGVLSRFTRRAEDRDSSWLLPDADIETLRARRCRSILIATDFVGTGDQVLKFARAILRHPSLRSWRSLRLLQLHVVAFAITPYASQRLKASKIIDGVWPAEAARDFSSAGWDREMREAIEELCVRECRSSAWPALGYQGSAGLFATQRRAPNNLPAVFLQDFPGWNPLFPEREVPIELAGELGDQYGAPPLPELALRLGQLRLGRNENLRYLRPESQRLLSALLLIQHKSRSTEQLAAELALTIEHAEALRETLLTLGFIDENGRATPAGQQEIQAQKRRRRRTTAHLQGDDGPYYPLALR